MFLQMLLISVAVSFSGACCGFRRRHWQRRVFIFLMFFAVLSGVLWLWARVSFAGEMKILFGIMPEELNPSDHHALLAEFSLHRP